jgi:hypothetical protein
VGRAADDSCDNSKIYTFCTSTCAADPCTLCGVSTSRVFSVDPATLLTFVAAAVREGAGREGEGRKRAGLKTDVRHMYHQ